MRSIRILLLALLVSLFAVDAFATVVSTGFNLIDDRAAVRYRSFGNTGGKEVFIGIPNVETGAKRTILNLHGKPCRPTTLLNSA